MDDINPVARGRQTAPDDVWEAVCADYLAGMPASACAHRHGVGVSTLRERAAREGWRRLDRGWTPPNRLDPCDEGVLLEEKVGGDLNKVAPRQLSFVAFRRLMRAVMRGDAVEALRWRRVQLVMEAVEAESERMIAQDDAVWEYYYGSQDEGDDADPAAGPRPADSSDSSD